MATKMNKLLALFLAITMLLSMTVFAVDPSIDGSVELICGMEEHAHAESCYDAEGNLIPGLHISRTLIITTSQGDTELYKPYIEGYLIPYILNAVGMNNVMWHNCARTSHGTDGNRKNFLKEVSDMV